MVHSLPWAPAPVIELDERLPWPVRLQAIPDDLRARVEELLAVMWQHVPAKYLWLAWPIALRTGFRYQREARALARLVHGDWRAILLASLCYELTLSTVACSTMALSTPTGPILARNMDFHPERELARASALVRYTRAGKLRFALAGWPGAIGAVTGLSAHGFALALNAVQCLEGLRRSGEPVLLFVRRVFEKARSFDEAMSMCASTPLMYSALLTLVGTENNERVVIERTPSRSSLRFAVEDRPLLATNHYCQMLLSVAYTCDEVLTTSGSRFEALSAYWEKHAAGLPLSDAELLYLLTSPQVEQWFTAQHVIARPAQQTIQMWTPRRFTDE